MEIPKPYSDAIEEYAEESGNDCVALDQVPTEYESWYRNAVREGYLTEKNFKDGSGFITSNWLYAVNKETADNIVRLMHAEPIYPYATDEKIDWLISRFEEKEGKRLGCEFRLHEYQRDAVHKAVKNQVCIVTGGPGTGKTCTLKCMLSVLEALFPDGHIKLCAPTGKAARRMKESTGHPASTVQKFIHLTDEYAEPVKVYADCLVIDEISMLDDLTANAVFAAIADQTKVILVGDTDQLPSVGFGSVLRDLIESTVVPIEKLAVPQRQDGESILFANITSLQNGSPFLFAGDDFEIVNAGDEDGRDKMLSVYFREVAELGTDNVCMLTPYRRKGKGCANRMNDIIQARLNPPGKTKHLKATIYENDDEYTRESSREIIFALGDPVIQLVNRDECANGDIGKVTEIRKDGITVQYEDVTVPYDMEELSQLNLAYAMSVHKSQGSEYKVVVTAVLPEHKGLMSRNLVYTAVTRAKKKCILIRDEETLQNGIGITAGDNRVTQLSLLLAESEEEWQIKHKSKAA